jgi:3-hydroxyisobutyrate dehydrogenase
VHDASIAVIGLGNMGAPMAERLVAAGHAVTGIDPSSSARERLVATGATTSKHLVDARGADVVILMLPDSNVVAQVVTGLLEAGISDTTVVDMSSSEPARTRGEAERLQAAGVAFADAPVSGGVGGAVAGTLTVMVGGSDEVVAGIRPILSHLGTVRHVGPVGAGHAIKALNNLTSAAHLWLTSEVVYIAERYGIQPSTALEVLNGSSGRSGSSEAKWPKFILPGSFDSGFAAGLMLKDIRIATKLADEVGRPSVLGDDVERLWAEAVEALPAGADHTRIAEYLAGRGESA